MDNIVFSRTDTELKVWDFTDEVDIEIWKDGKYITTLTVSTEDGTVVHQAYAADLEA